MVAAPPSGPLSGKLITVNSTFVAPGAISTGASVPVAYINALGGISSGPGTDQLAGQAGLVAVRTDTYNGTGLDAIATLNLTTQPTAPDTGSGVHALAMNTHLTGTIPVSTLASIYAISYNDQTAGTIVHHWGIVGRTFNTSSATPQISAGCYGNAENTGPGTTTTAAAFWGAGCICTAGVITSAYGLYAQAHSVTAPGVITNAIGVYADVSTVGSNANVGISIGANAFAAGTMASLISSGVLTGVGIVANSFAPAIFGTGGATTYTCVNDQPNFIITPTGLATSNLCVHQISLSPGPQVNSPVGSLFGLRINMTGTSTGSSTVTNLYGIYLDPIGAGLATTRFGIYQAGTEQSVLNGSLQTNGGIFAIHTAASPTGLGLQGIATVTAASNTGVGTGITTVLFVNAACTSVNLVGLQVSMAAQTIDPTASVTFVMGLRVALGSLSFTNGVPAIAAAIYLDSVAIGTAKYGIYQAGTEPHRINGNLVLSDGVNLVLGTNAGAGVMIGTVGGAGGQKLGFFGKTPIVQPSAVGTAVGFAAGATAVTFHSDDTYTGGIGATAYTLNGIVAALKNFGLLAL